MAYQSTQDIVNRLASPLFSQDIVSTVQLTGKWQNKTAYCWSILGRRSAFVNNTELHDICDFLGNTTGQQTFTPVTTADTLEIVSSSAADSALGAGTRSVRVIYLDVSGNLQESPEIALNGTAPVAANFTATGIISMEAVTGGNNETSTGNIDLRKTVGLLQTSTIYERITAGGNKSLSARMMVPAGFTGYLIDWNVSAIAQTIDARLRSNTRTLDRSINNRAVFQKTIFASNGATVVSTLNYLKIPPLARIKVSAIPGGTANARCDTNFSILLIAN